MSKKSPAQKKWIQILHVAKRECGLDEDAYRALLDGACGVESASGIKTWKQYYAALGAFRRLGFRIQTKTGRTNGLKETDTETPRNPDWISARQEYYIKGLWDLASRVKDEASLRAMVKRIGHVEDIRFLQKTDATNVILALRDIAQQAGFYPDSQTRKIL